MPAETAKEIAETLSPEARRINRELLKLVRERRPLDELARLRCGLCAVAANAIRENWRILARVPGDEGTLAVLAKMEAELAKASRELELGPNDWTVFAMRSCPLEAEVAIAKALST